MDNTIKNDEPLSPEDEAMLAEALKEARVISDQITKESNEFGEKADNLTNKINAGLDEIEKMDVDLQDAEKETTDELDKLILEQAEDLAAEN